MPLLFVGSALCVLAVILVPVALKLLPARRP